jgi:hypothetical protein
VAEEFAGVWPVAKEFTGVWLLAEEFIGGSDWPRSVAVVRSIAVIV